MPSIGTSIATSSFERLLKEGKEIPWEEVVNLGNIVGGEIRVEKEAFCYQGPISGITLKNGVVSIMCPWILRTPMDEDGDPVGDFSPEAWEVTENPKLPITITVPKTKYQEGEDLMFYTAREAYPMGNWVVRQSEYSLSFFCGAGAIFLVGDSSRLATLAHDLASKFGLSI